MSELVHRDTEMDRFARLGLWLAASETDNPNVTERGASAALRLYMAHQLGLPAWAAAEIYVIKGNLSVSVDLMRGLARQNGYQVVKVESSPESVTAAVVEIATGEELGRQTFTMAMAQQAGLVKDGGNWRKYPQRMLWHRAAKFAMQDTIPDVVLGLITHDEAAEIDGRVIAEEDLPPAEPAPDVTEPEPTPEPVPVPPPDDDAGDAQVHVDAAKAEFDAVETTPATDKQRRRMHALFREKGADRAQRLAFCTEVAGRDVSSSADMTADEVSKVIGQLEQMPPPAPPVPEPVDNSADTAVDNSAVETKLLALDSLIANTLEERATTIRDVWIEVAGYRRVRPLDLITELDGQDGAGHLRWLPLREALRKDEVGDLTRFVEQARREAGLPDDIPF